MAKLTESYLRGMIKQVLKEGNFLPINDEPVDAGSILDDLEHMTRMLKQYSNDPKQIDEYSNRILDMVRALQIHHSQSLRK